MARRLHCGFQLRAAVPSRSAYHKRGAAHLSFPSSRLVHSTKPVPATVIHFFARSGAFARFIPFTRTCHGHRSHAPLLCNFEHKYKSRAVVTTSDVSMPRSVMDMPLTASSDPATASTRFPKSGAASAQRRIPNFNKASAPILLQPPPCKSPNSQTMGNELLFRWEDSPALSKFDLSPRFV